ncbi:hypothetical protein AB4383_16185 [Vibrio breoganii]
MNIVKHFLKLLVLYIRLLKCRFSSPKTGQLTSLTKLRIANDNDTCVVIGNGPSLTNDMKELIEKDGVDYFCVNHLAESEFFTLLKPNKYTLLDPYFWSKDTDEKLKRKRENLFEALNDKVTWEMFLFLPRNADSNYLKSRIKNDHVIIVKLDVVPIIELHHAKLPNIFLKGKYAPPTCNVIIYAMYLAILSRYKSIELYGADLSFTEDVIVDQKTNQLQIEYKHFYGKSTFEPLLQNPQRIVPFTMESLYKTTYLTFYAHNLLSKMAQLAGVRIVNRSSYSLIDAYDRE